MQQFLVIFSNYIATFPLLLIAFMTEKLTFEIVHELRQTYYILIEPWDMF